MVNKGKGKEELFFTWEMDERRIKNVNSTLARLDFGFRKSIDFFVFFKGYVKFMG